MSFKWRVFTCDEEVDCELIRKISLLLSKDWSLNSSQEIFNSFPNCSLLKAFWPSNFHLCLPQIFLFSFLFLLLSIYIRRKYSWKFSTSGFQWIYTFWDVLTAIWSFLGNVCLSVCQSVGLSVLFCGRCILRTNGRKLMKLNIQLHLYRT